jgi:hypothetical protein
LETESHGIGAQPDEASLVLFRQTIELQISAVIWCDCHALHPGNSSEALGLLQHGHAMGFQFVVLLCD